MMAETTRKTDTVPALSDEKIVASWHKNAGPWTSAVRDEQIESRKLVTNEAIESAVLSRSPQSVIDIGCGEGWLARRLADRGIQVLGTDVVPGLISAAMHDARCRFEVISYEAIAKGAITEKFDLAVCNFSLLGKESVDDLVKALPGLINRRGALVIQTIHPVIGTGEQPYVDGWREGSWAGFSSDFSDPAPWYFRTLETWVALLTTNGFGIEEIREPVNPKTGKPASVILIAKNLE